MTAPAPALTLIHDTLPRRRPWLAASLAAHLALAASLYTAGPVRIERRQGDNVRAQVNAALAQTAQREMHRQLRAMDKIRAALADSAGLPAAPAPDAATAADPARQARALAAAIEQVRQRIRATEMARVLRLPESEALKRVQAEAARRPRPAVPRSQRPEDVVAQLAAQARAALAERRGQLLSLRQGVAVKGVVVKGSGAPGAGPQGSGRAGDGKHKGSGGGAGAGSSNTPSAAQAGRLNALVKGLGMETPLALTGSSLDMASSGFSDARSYGDYLAPPPVDAGRMHAGAGRVLGAGGPFANRVVLDTWYVIGPFAGQGQDSQGAVYPPERGIDLDAVYYGKNDLPVRWTWQQYDSYPAVPRPRAENAVYYAYTEIEVDHDMDLWAWLGADDDSKMWFNDDLVWISPQVDDKAWYRQPFHAMHEAIAARNLTEGQRRLHFHKGRNTILFKLYNGIDLMFFSVVLSSGA